LLLSSTPPIAQVTRPVRNLGKSIPPPMPMVTVWIV
jgi:hypothetical protein